MSLFFIQFRFNLLNLLLRLPEEDGLFYHSIQLQYLTIRRSIRNCTCCRCSTGDKWKLQLLNSSPSIDDTAQVDLFLRNRTFLNFGFEWRENPKITRVDDHNPKWIWYASTYAQTEFIIYSSSPRFLQSGRKRSWSRLLLEDPVHRIYRFAQTQWGRLSIAKNRFSQISTYFRRIEALCNADSDQISRF